MPDGGGQLANTFGLNGCGGITKGGEQQGNPDPSVLKDKCGGCWDCGMMALHFPRANVTHRTASSPATQITP